MESSAKRLALGLASRRGSCYLLVGRGASSRGLETTGNSFWPAAGRWPPHVLTQRRRPGATPRSVIAVLRRSVRVVAIAWSRSLLPHGDSLKRRRQERRAERYLLLLLESRSRRFHQNSYETFVKTSNGTSWMTLGSASRPTDQRFIP